MIVFTLFTARGSLCDVCWFCRRDICYILYLNCFPFLIVRTWIKLRQFFNKWHGYLYQKSKNWIVTIGTNENVSCTDLINTKDPWTQLTGTCIKLFCLNAQVEAEEYMLKRIFNEWRCCFQYRYLLHCELLSWLINSSKKSIFETVNYIW